MIQSNMVSVAKGFLPLHGDSDFSMKAFDFHFSLKSFKSNAEYGTPYWSKVGTPNPSIGFEAGDKPFLAFLGFGYAYRLDNKVVLY